jgi:hypothetical protein
MYAELAVTNYLVLNKTPQFPLSERLKVSDMTLKSLYVLKGFFQTDSPKPSK